MAPPWGIATPRRGRTMHDVAVEFAKRFPVQPHPDAKGPLSPQHPSITITQDDLAEFFADMDLLDVPDPTVANRNEMEGYTGRRNRLRYALNHAARHPNMRSRGIEPYEVASDGENLLDIRLTVTGLCKHRGSAHLQIASARSFSELKELFQSLDLTQFSSEDYDKIENVFLAMQENHEDRLRIEEKDRRQIARLEQMGYDRDKE